MADNSTRAKTGSGGPGSGAIANDDAYTYSESDNGYDDFVDKTYDKTKDARSY